ncbi:MAG: LLM class F420-dependent oxidoreductase [Gammaproteobacteria bacterium]|nr:LLM class F420-dependent oxidoreductase [Gammaproteobacteria bacterium]
MTAFGLVIFPTDYAIAPAQLAQEAEARGFEALFFPEHTHIPASRLSPWPGGGDLPKEYSHTHDPFVALGMAASVTKTLRLGTGISLVTERDPILMAKQVATLDHLSGGRVLLGVGAGWNAEEMANHGVEFASRWKVLRERVLAMRRIWSDEEAEFHGEFVDFDPIWAYPKPAQPGGPKVLLGASSRWTWPRIAEYGDGWFPIYQNPERAAESGGVDYATGIQATRDAWAQAGRTGEPDFTVFGVGPKQGVAESLFEIGFNRVVFSLPPAPADVVLPMLDRYAAIASSIKGG